MVKYSQNLARARQWKKRFNPVHAQLKTAYNSYVNRRNNRLNNMAMARRSKKYKKPLHFQLGYGKHTLRKTKVYYNGKKRRSTGGKQVWRKGFRGFWHTG